ncbi:phospholipase [Rhodomicrobium udaipurense JA643]|uniref:Alpha/beta fold hydrolase n=1 Tax=Rhodomicrobium udaipurense TaxID=1202716 RepID=A0A8I1GCY1_9HYPH|nr:alpha/beta fold hydrolase [Rhodomicrobium udaipurense]KAI94944.1 phospholipase [Rhodomicrobium udaipurense JA643]MBJ7542609.1 alpha/beta fold hydrolase [Rhodomicrobium udaipurense]
MPALLDGPRLAPASGDEAKQLVIFLHGYGADGNDLIGLGREWAPLLPDAAFVSPDAPETIPGYFGGRQWFSLSTRSEREWEEGVLSAEPALAAFIEDEARKAGLPLSKVALVGFSQGTMMALQTGLRLPEPVAGIVAFSGHLAGATRLESEIKAKPPVLLLHGSVDEVIPVAAIHLARETLAAVGVPVQWQIRPGLGHGIDGQGLLAAGQFLRACFGLD